MINDEGFTLGIAENITLPAEAIADSRASSTIFSVNTLLLSKEAKKMSMLPVTTINIAIFVLPLRIDALRARAVITMIMPKKISGFFPTSTHPRM